MVVGGIGVIGERSEQVRVGLGQDPRDVDSSTIRRAKNLLDASGDAHRRQFLAVVLAGFGAVVRHEDDLVSVSRRWRRCRLMMMMKCLDGEGRVSQLYLGTGCRRTRGRHRSRRGRPVPKGKG